MAKTSPRQRRITGRVMHEFAHGELESGSGRKVKNRRQAIAIALEEAGASRNESKQKNKRNLHKTERKEARGETAQQEREGRSHIGARGRGESTRSMGGRGKKGKSARSSAREKSSGSENTRSKSSGAKSSHSTARRKSGGRRGSSNGPTKATLYRRAKARNIPGRSKMSKGELERALG